MERGLVLALIAAPTLSGAALAHQPEPAPATTPAQAQTPPITPDQPDLPDELLPPVDRGWTFRFQPAYWYASPRGELSLPGAIGPIDFGGSTFEPDDDADLSDLDVDDPTSAFLGRAHFARDRWRISFAATSLGISGNSSPTAPGRLGDAFFVPGDSIDTEFDMSTFELSVSYLVAHGPTPGQPGDPERFRYTLELLAGARLEHLDIDVRVTPGAGSRPEALGLSDDASELFGQPMVGARLTMDLFDDFSIEVGATAGYWSVSGQQTSSTWDVLAAFTWRPIDNVGIELGYRNLGLSAEEGGDTGAFEYRGTAAGLFAGLVIQF